MKNIKHLKPKNKGFKQGYFDGNNPLKYVGDRPIIYRSGLEYRFMHWCEGCTEVIEWSSEPFPIKYYTPDGKEHDYWIDFTLKMKSGVILLIEVKPMSQVPLNEAQVNLNAVMMKNALKWKATIDFCKRQKIPTKFKIITEKFFNK